MSAQIIHIEVADSTNLCLQQMAANGLVKHGSLLVAHTQTAGRGQRGNSWESNPGENLTASALLFPHFLEPSRQFMLTMVASLALTDLLGALAPEFEWKIKWPNDIYVNNRKIAGILIENQLSGNSFDSSIIGIGLNINQKIFVTDAPNPVSLHQLTGKTYLVSALAEQLLDRLLQRYAQLENGHSHLLETDYLHKLYRMDVEAHYLFDNVEIVGSIRGVDEYGRLVVAVTATGETVVAAFKEIVFLL